MLLAEFVQFFTLQPVRFSGFKNFIRYMPTSFSYCFSVFKNNFCLSSFDLQIRRKKVQGQFKIGTKDMPTVACFIAINLFSLVKRTFKCLFEQMHKWFIGIYDSESACVITLLSSFAGRKMFYSNAAFTIDYTSQICKICDRVHMDTLYHKYTKYHSERLNPEALNWDAIV